MFRLLKQPLVHFFVAGGLLFYLFNLLNGDVTRLNNRQIIIDDQALMEQMQYSAKSFSPMQSRLRLAQMSAQEKQAAANVIIEDNVLYQEALAQGLDKNDFVIKNRLLQKMRFLLQSQAELDVDLSDQQLVHYFQAHQQQYARKATVTFTHVFIDNHKHQDAKLAATKLLERLTSTEVSFQQATQYGDRFAYFNNYVERSGEYIANQFGEAFKNKLFAEDRIDQWQGPIASKYGWHLVFISKKTPQMIPPFAQVKGLVRQDVKALAAKNNFQQQLQALSDKYSVDIQYSVSQAANETQ